jgi:hypothetical protein
MKVEAKAEVEDRTAGLQRVPPDIPHFKFRIRSYAMDEKMGEPRGQCGLQRT